MRALVFIFSLTIAGCICLQWKPLKTYQESYWEAMNSVEQAAESMEQIMLNRTEDSFDFIKMMETSKIVKSFFNTVTPKNLECQNRFEDLKNNFMIILNRLEVPLLQRIAELRQRLSGLNSNMISYQRTADYKYWICKLSSAENCTDVVNQWIEQKILSSYCEMVLCESHIIRKRQFNLFGWGQDDQQFGQDEAKEINTCTPNEFECLNAVCILNDYVCDGIKDCTDGSDEQNCIKMFNYNTTTCNLEHGTYLCANKNCVALSSVCDGKDDCKDNSDEQNCTKKFKYNSTTCSLEHGTYLCANKNCVTLSSVCDGKDDCEDNSDEQNCNKKINYNSTNCNLEHGTYLCGNKNCIALSSVCDEKDDCEDGTDEGGNCTESCPDCHPRGVCFRTPQSAGCFTGCPKGLFETASGCQRSIETEWSPVSHLVFDTTRLISRHSAAYLLLKQRFISEIYMLSFVNDCRNRNYPVLDRITKLKDAASYQHPKNTTGSQ